MELADIEVISQTDLTQVTRVLTSFLDRNQTVYDFPSLSIDDRRVRVWTALFQHLQNSQATDVHTLCLTTIKILSRDQTDLGNLICKKWINVLAERAGLHHLAAYDEESRPSACFPHKNIILEALKCLNNICFNSEAARMLCTDTCLAEGLVCRLRIYRELPSKNDILFFDMKLLFILTALRDDFKNKIKNELHGMAYLVNCLKEILSDAAKNSTDPGILVLDDSQLLLVCEIIKTQFNLVSRPDDPKGSSTDEDAMFLQIMPLLYNLLLASTITKTRQMELSTHVSNFLTSVPESHYAELSPPLVGTEEGSQFGFEGHNMDAMQVLLELLQHRLDNAKDMRTQFEMLCAILTVMYKAAHGSRVQRKFLRSVILPPLRDVSEPPERGDALRNQLCRLLTSPVTKLRDLAAEFLFVLCKEKVGRMVKYTGFGNAAGLLAQKGLLGGARETEYSSSSDDSDTEEYRAAQPRLDPVVGCTRPPRVNPLEGMSEEQKEYEAMQLVDLFDKLTSSGVIRPARIGEDGRPQPVRHLLELRDAPPAPPAPPTPPPTQQPHS